MTLKGSDVWVPLKGSLLSVLLMGSFPLSSCCLSEGPRVDGACEEPVLPPFL